MLIVSCFVNGVYYCIVFCEWSILRKSRSYIGKAADLTLRQPRDILRTYFVSRLFNGQPKDILV